MLTMPMGQLIIRWRHRQGDRGDARHDRQRLQNEPMHPSLTWGRSTHPVVTAVKVAPAVRCHREPATEPHRCHRPLGRRQDHGRAASRRGADLPVVHLDRLYWGPGWAAIPPEVFRLDSTLSRPATPGSSTAATSPHQVGGPLSPRGCHRPRQGAATDLHLAHRQARAGAVTRSTSGPSGRVRGAAEPLPLVVDARVGGPIQRPDRGHPRREPRRTTCHVPPHRLCLVSDASHDGEP